MYKSHAKTQVVFEGLFQSEIISIESPPRVFSQERPVDVEGVGVVGPNLLQNLGWEWDVTSSLISTWLYRVTIHVVPNLPLTSKQELCFSGSPLY